MICPTCLDKRCVTKKGTRKLVDGTRVQRFFCAKCNKRFIETPIVPELLDDSGAGRPCKILIFDIETAPILSYIWSLWSKTYNYALVERDWFILSFSAKWLGSDIVVNHKLPDYDTFKHDMEDDTKLMYDLWKLFNEADMVVAHNGDKFDIKKVNTRFIVNGFGPPSPYKSIDTLKVAKSTFAFTSNRLDSLGEMLGLGRKVTHEGFEMWRKCMQGDKETWDNMMKYNEQDVILLEKIYLKLRPFMKNHPNVAIYQQNDELTCRNCGHSEQETRGYSHLNAGIYRRYHCAYCGKWTRGTTNLLGKDKQQVRNII